jgi:hypothetical protein
MDPGARPQHFDTLQRYAGWLDRDRTSVMVRADVRALGIAIDASADPSPSLLALDTNIARLPGGDLRKMIRIAAGQLRSELIEPRGDADVSLRVPPGVS